MGSGFLNSEIMKININDNLWMDEDDWNKQREWREKREKEFPKRNKKLKEK